MCSAPCESQPFLFQAEHPDVTGTFESLGPQRNMDFSLIEDLATVPVQGAAYSCTAIRADIKAGTDHTPAQDIGNLWRLLSLGYHSAFLQVAQEQ